MCVCIQVESGSVCAVFGLGAVGLAAVMGCVMSGAGRVIGVDVNPEKFAKAREFGVTECVNPRDHSRPVQEVLVEMTAGGVDYALECVGDVEVMVSVCVCVCVKKNGDIAAHLWFMPTVWTGQVLSVMYQLVHYWLV